MNTWIVGNYLDHYPPDDCSLVIADPVYGTDMVSDIALIGENSKKIPTICFMWPEDIHGLVNAPEQICFWVKPVSTKNTSKKYSRFIETICMWNVSFYGDLHWANRTGVFTDILLENKSHPWKKPYSLIERLVLNHYPGHGTVYDPCAGSGVVHEVCKAHNIPSISIEIDPKYAR